MYFRKRLFYIERSPQKRRKSHQQWDSIRVTDKQTLATLEKHSPTTNEIKNMNEKKKIICNYNPISWRALFQKEERCFKLKKTYPASLTRHTFIWKILNPKQELKRSSKST